MGEREDAERIRAQIEYWKQVVSVQTHFNDMCIRTRWVGLTVWTTLLAGSGVALAQYPSGFVSAGSVAVHVSAILLLIAGLVAAALWRLDRMYYFNMLLASVEHGEKIEKSLPAILGDMVSAGTITETISKKVSRRQASFTVELLYWGQAAIPLLLATIVICNFHPESATPKVSSAEFITATPSEIIENSTAPESTTVEHTDSTLARSPIAKAE